MSNDPTFSNAPGNVVTDPEALQPYTRDFGGIVHETPRGVLKARDAKDVADGLKYCHENGIDAVARGYGQSGQGQCVGRDALIFDVTALDTIESVDASRIVTGAGARWIDVLKAGASADVTVPVYTNHTLVSVGGSLSFGGVGAMSHRYGLQVDHVEELEVALVTGELARCSRLHRPELYRAALAGLGQFGYITKASLLPTARPREVAIVHLVYDDLATTIEDLETLTRQNRFDSIDNYVVPGPPHVHVNEIGLFVYGDEPVPDVLPLLKGLKGKPEIVRSAPYEEYVLRNQGLLAALSGDMAELKKPWATLMLHPSKAHQFVKEHMEPLIDRSIGTIVFVMQPLPAWTTQSSSLPLPRGTSGWVTAFALVRAVPQEQLGEALALNRKLYEAAIALGGTVYPYSSFSLTPQDWPAIFGDAFPAYAERKRKYDPKGILNPNFGIVEAVFGKAKNR